jgi:O-antigen/teichoic acid export membrane protein
VFCIPPLIRGLGTDRFGILSLAWVLVGYFSLLDLGLGRTLTKYVAERLGTEEEKEVPELFWTSLFLMACVGFVGMAVLFVISPLLVHSLLKVPQALQADTLNAIYVLALTVPVVSATAGLRGFLEAMQRFDLVSAIRIPLGVFMFAGPLMVLPFSRSLVPVALVLAVGRVVGWGASMWLCAHVTPELRRSAIVRTAHIKPLIRFGSWLTVSNIISPVMVYLDRFIISIFASVATVAYYVTPYEIVTKLLFIPGAIVAVLFPALSAKLIGDRNRSAMLDQGMKYIFLTIYPIVLITVTFSDLGLTFWLGKDFGRQSAPVLEWLTVGILFNALAQVPFAQLQAAGKPNVTAKLHMIELPFYVLALCWAVRAEGIVGAAAVWTGRVFVDMVALFILSQRLLASSVAVVRRVAVAVAVSLPVVGLGASISGVSYKFLFLFIALSGLVVGAWYFILTPDERAYLQSRIKQIPASSYAD